MLRIEDESGALAVAVAGRDLDDVPHEVEFQSPYDEDESYCLVNEMHIPVYAGLTSIKLSGTALRLRLTAEAAHEWMLRSTRMTIKLRLSQPEVDQLRAALHQLFVTDAHRWPSLDLDLKNP
jgi:hypothetical protein